MSKFFCIFAVDFRSRCILIVFGGRQAYDRIRTYRNNTMKNKKWTKEVLNKN